MRQNRTVDHEAYTGVGGEINKLSFENKIVSFSDYLVEPVFYCLGILYTVAFMEYY